MTVPDPETFPVVGDFFAAGPDDTAFDYLLLVGPVLVVAIAVADRSTLTMAAAALYLLCFLGYVVWKGLRVDR